MTSAERKDLEVSSLFELATSIEETHALLTAYTEMAIEVSTEQSIDPDDVRAAQRKAYALLEAIAIQLKALHTIMGRAYSLSRDQRLAKNT